MACKVIIGDISKDHWERYAVNFADYSIYQTWGYQQVRAQMADQRLSRIVIKNKNGSVVTMCQVRIKHFRPLGLRIGYVQWGPLFRSRDNKIICEADALDTLRRVCLKEQVNVLRVVPNACADDTGREFAGLLKASGFEYVRSAAPYYTILLSLEYPQEVLRTGLHQSWRRKLKKAESAGIEIREGTDEKLFGILERLYIETLHRKKFRGLNPQEFVRSQRILSATERMNVIVAYHRGEPVSAHATSNLGDTAVLLLAASNEDGLECKASYLVWWQAVMTSGLKGMKRYDVGGIDFKNNPAVSQFKAGLGGKECFYIGVFEACNSLRTKTIWRMAEKVHRCITGK